MRPEIEARGARLVAISPQTPANSRKSQRDNKLNFPILSEPGAAVAEKFGLRFSLRVLKAEAVINLIADWSRDYDHEKSSLILARLRRDVGMLNGLARQKLGERGIVEDGHVFKTADGARRFAAGDQIVFLKNEGSISVKNGTLPGSSKPGPVG